MMQELVVKVVTLVELAVTLAELLMKMKTRRKLRVMVSRGFQWISMTFLNMSCLRQLAVNR
jgi:hypothetical protein